MPTGNEESRFARQVGLFGEPGQEKIRRTSVAVVGIGGLGTHVVQQLALLGVKRLALIDAEELDETNRNRYIGAYCFDPIPGSLKVQLGARLAKAIDPSIAVNTVADSFVSDAGFEAVRNADWIFGCVDREGARLVLTELCSAYGRPYVDLATDVIPDTRPEYGGRVLVSNGGKGCLVCYDELDSEEAQADLSGPDGARQRAEIYGVDHFLLSVSGPSVVSLNGLIASLGVTEFMVAVTGLRDAVPLQRYLGREKRFTQPSATSGLPHTGCYYCSDVYGRGAAADVDRYLRNGYGAFLR
jgi:hypothetical protein